ncbi:hypothetical protein [Agrococcus baldri]|uniref:Uncharacterized protein n=1 Tax=Agrococcus baldri TaxID=153730 RepID=A0AA87RLY3_9MICO|nr:hypothetical protein [Agrococcus baldri]GEK81408.1 hypothetical protein ABA31_27590 [Agrococcus baldri]
MTAPVVTRTPAASLRVTFRPDGAALLELLVDWYTVLGAAECAVDDAEGIAKVLRSWATAAQPEARPRHVARPGAASSELRHDYGRGFAVTLVQAAPRAASATAGRGDGERFVEMFGSEVPTDVGRVDAFVKQLAHAVGRCFRDARRSAEQRLAGGAYLPVLRTYLDQLRALGDDPSAYRRLEHTLVAILETERYLRIADDEGARRLVAAIDDEVSRLYGRSMDLERGGQR